MSNATYNALGRLASLSLGNGLTTNYQYWGLDYGGPAHFGAIRSIITTPGALQSLTYDYDAKLNITRIDDNNGHGLETINFGYDHLDRLASALFPSFNETYQYNAIGNRTSKTLNGNGTSYYYPPAGQPHPHAPISVGGQSYLYDNNGNLMNAEGRAYGYNEQNRLTSLTGAGLASRSFLYDGDGALRELSVNGPQTIRYVTPDYQVNPPTGEATVYYTFGGRMVAWRNNTILRYLLGDHLSSTRGEANEAGGEAAQRRYLPFGGDRPVAGANDLTRDERYTGQKRIDNGGGNANREMYHYGARWYLSGVGIFSQPDPIVPSSANPQALNRFSYVLNNPLRYTDPTGYDPFGDDWLAQFQAAHGRDPEWYDYSIRLFSLAYPDEWNDDVWRQFYSNDGTYKGNAALNEVYRRAGEGRSWATMGAALDCLASYYTAAEEGQFVRDVGLLFAGLAHRSEAGTGSHAVQGAQIHPNVYIRRDGLGEAWTGTVDEDANVHHWAWSFIMGYSAGRDAGLIGNTVHELQQAGAATLDRWTKGRWGLVGPDMSDIFMGSAGVAMGAELRDRSGGFGIGNIGAALAVYLPIR